MKRRLPHLSAWAPTLTQAGRAAPSLPAPAQSHSQEGLPILQPHTGSPWPRLPPQAWRPLPCWQSCTSSWGDRPLWGPHLTAVLAADPWLCPLPSPQPSFQGQSEVSAIFETRRLPAAAGLPERRLPRLRMGPPPPDGRAASDRSSGGFGTLLLLLLPNMVLGKTQAQLSFLRQQSNKPLSARQLLL